MQVSISTTPVSNVARDRSINGANASNWSDLRRDLCRYYMVGRKLPPWLINAYLMLVGKWLTLLAPF